jgi:hypothetical protein
MFQDFLARGAYRLTETVREANRLAQAALLERLVRDFDAEVLRVIALWRGGALDAATLADARRRFDARFAAIVDGHLMLRGAGHAEQSLQAHVTLYRRYDSLLDDIEQRVTA